MPTPTTDSPPACRAQRGVTFEQHEAARLRRLAEVARLAGVGGVDPAAVVRPDGREAARGVTTGRGQGSPGRPVVSRRADGTGERVHPSVRGAVRWLKAHGRPNAAGSAIYEAIAEGCPRYGLLWRRPDGA